MGFAEAFKNRYRQAIKDGTALVANHAAANHRFISRTGNLERSIQSEETDLKGIVYLNDKQAPYGPAIHNGARARVIVPRNRKALRWVAGGKFVFAKRVNWPGIKADPFLYQALDAERGEVAAVFDRYTDLAAEDIANMLVR